MLIGVCGNTLIFIAYCLSRRLQTKTNIFVINLAAADILTCACLPITTLALLLDVNVNTRSWLDPLCAVDIGAIKVSFNCSFTTLTLIALNRYVLITKSKGTYKRIFQRKFILMLVCISWLYPILYATPQIIFGLYYLGYDEKTHSCNVLSDNPIPYLYDILSAGHIILKITLIVISYGKIHLFLRRHNKRMQRER